MKLFKKLLATLIAMLFLSTGIAFGASGMGGGVSTPAYWYLDGATLKPVNSSWSVWLPVGGTADGAFTVDVDDDEALLVRKDGDLGDVFLVDTNNSNVEIDNDLDVVDNITAGDVIIDEATGVLQFSGATSASILSDADALTIGGVNGASNNENLVFDFETVANAVGVTSGTGVLDLSFTGIDLNTTTEVSAENLVSTDDADVNDNLTIGDLVIDEAIGTIDFTGVTSATITSSGFGAISFDDENLSTAGTLDAGVTTATSLNLKANANQIVLDSDDGSGFTTTLTDSATGARTITFPDASGTIALASSSAPVDATYITQTANGTLTAEQALGALATGILKNTTTTGVLSIATDGTDYLSSLAVDTSPQLGGDLDSNSQDIYGVVQLAFSPSSDEARLDDSAITCSNTLNRVAGDGGAVVLDTIPSIADGAYDGQICYIEGTSDVNTVQLADNTNVQLAGDIDFTLGKGNILAVMWDSDDSEWWEISRSDN